MKDIREFGRFRIDSSQKAVFFNNAPVDLPLKAIEVLCVLTEHRGDVVTKQDLLDRVWAGTFVEESNISRHVYLLRKMFKDLGEDDDLIQTVPRRGYRFTGEVRNFSGDLVIEHHVIEQTVIEDLDDFKPDHQTLPRAIAGKRRNGFIFLAGVLLIVTISGLAWRYSSSPTRTNLLELRSIAVLPLRSFSTAQTDEDLRLRITDAIITKLASGETDLSVRPTRAVLPFSNTDKDSIGIGKSLQVDAVIDGRVQQEGDRLRVTLQLVSVKTGEQIWSHQFDGQVNGILDLQDAISAQILKKLGHSVQSGPAKRLTSNDEAYEKYLRGRFSWNKRSAESLQSAISAFESAIKLEPTFAEAYVGLADSYYLLFDYGYDTSSKNVEAAKETVKKAIQLNPELADAYTTLGLIQTTNDWNWKDAEASLRKAIELAPNSSNAHHRLGVLMIKLRRFDEAEIEMQRAKDLDPTSTAINMNLAIAFRNSGKYEIAIEKLKNTLELDSAFTPAVWYLARSYWLSGDHRESVLQWAKAIDSDGDRDLARMLVQDLNVNGERSAIKKLSVEWQQRLGQDGINEHDLAILHAALGNKKETLDWLERCFAAHHPWATWINSEPEFDLVRDDRRFVELMRRMNFD